jgi:hypothetical protein
MAHRTFLSRDFETTYDICIEDIIEFIEGCTDEEKAKISQAISFKPKRQFLGGNLYDDMRLSYLKEIFEKYSLDELKDLAKNK